MSNVTPPLLRVLYYILVITLMQLYLYALTEVYICLHDILMIIYTEYFHLVFEASGVVISCSHAKCEVVQRYGSGVTIPFSDKYVLFCSMNLHL